MCMQILITCIELGTAEMMWIEYVHSIRARNLTKIN